MDPAKPDINISDVVMTTAGRDAGQWFYVIDADPVLLFLANGKDRTLEKPKRKKRKHVAKVLRSETRVAEEKVPATKCSTANYEEIWRSSPEKMQANNLGG